MNRLRNGMAEIAHIATLPVCAQPALACRGIACSGAGGRHHAQHQAGLIIRISEGAACIVFALWISLRAAALRLAGD